MRLDDEKPQHTEVDDPPTVASVAAVASTTDDVDAAEPAHPDRPVGARVDTASLGTEPGDTEGVEPDDGGEGAVPADGAEKAAATSFDDSEE